MSPGVAPAALESSAERASVPEVRIFRPQDQGFLADITRLAETYPHPHSVFGGPEAGPYVHNLADHRRFSGEGWFGAASARGLAAVHLGVYGVGDGRGHSLFKLRHPLSEGPEGLSCLVRAFDAARRAATHTRPGSQKLVVFLGEAERIARQAAEGAGFRLEGTLDDYYRLGERCFILGHTVADPR